MVIGRPWGSRIQGWKVEFPVGVFFGNDIYFKVCPLDALVILLIGKE